MEILRAIADRIGRRAREPSFGRKLLVLAEASSSVPSTEKCSLESRTFTCG
jgi:hypothetical protein